MNQTKSKELSALAKAALALDGDFIEMERLSEELGRLEIETDNGMKRAQLLLGHFGEASTRIGDNISSLANALVEAQTRATQAAQLVSERAVLIQRRQQQASSLLQRFNMLGEALRVLNESVLNIRRLSQGENAGAAAPLLAKHLPELNSKLDELIEEVRRIEADADAANLKGLRRDADALGQSMQAMRKKLEALSS